MILWLGSDGKTESCEEKKERYLPLRNVHFNSDSSEQRALRESELTVKSLREESKNKLDNEEGHNALYFHLMFILLI